MEKKSFEWQLHHYGNSYIDKVSNLLGVSDEVYAKKSRALVMKEFRAMLASSEFQGKSKKNSIRNKKI